MSVQYKYVFNFLQTNWMFVKDGIVDTVENVEEVQMKLQNVFVSENAKIDEKIFVGPMAEDIQVIVNYTELPAS